MISMDKNGGRTVYLFIPFEHKGKKIESIVLAPVCFGHTLRWNDGDWKTSVEFLTELAGVEEAIIRSLRFPDADRVMECFVAMVTPEIRNDIVAGTIPQKSDYLPAEETPAATNGSGRPLDDDSEHGSAPLNMPGSGDPLPPAGFDLSEEP